MTPSPTALPFLRHIERCHQVDMPGGRIAVRVGSDEIGWASPTLAANNLLAPYRTATAISLPKQTDLQALGEQLADAGLYARHHELFDVRNTAGGVIGQIDRGAIPVLGLLAEGVHMNGLVDLPSGPHLWIARRSMTKRLDPGKLDHLVAGGMSAGLTPEATLSKEAAEEAGISEELSRNALPVAKLRYTLARPEGLRRDLLHCYDLHLPPSFTPRAMDGEVESFHLEPLDAIFARLRDHDDFKFNVNLVLIDLFLRRGMFAPDDHALLSHALYGAV